MFLRLLLTQARRAGLRMLLTRALNARRLRTVMLRRGDAVDRLIFLETVLRRARFPLFKYLAIIAKTSGGIF
jgi:hypothetical protein